LLPTLPLRTRALVVLQIACALPVEDLVALRLKHVTLAPRGVRLRFATGDRELVGCAISEARAYVKVRLKESGDDSSAPLFEGCRGRAISPAYARKLLHAVAMSIGITGSLIAATRRHGGGLGGW
jgi:integrase